MPIRRPLVPLVLVSFALVACPAEPPDDLPVDGGDTPDAGDTSDEGPPDGCLPATFVGPWTSPFFFSDSEAAFEAALDSTGKLRLAFLRYTDDFVGTFPLGPDGADGDLGTCARCVTLVGDGFTLFARGGTLTTELDPFERRLRGKLEGVWLTEVSDPASPPADPICVTLADVTFDEAVPHPEWTCPREKWMDGVTCDCECGVYDPDCEDAAKPTTCTGGRVCAQGNLPDRSPFDPPTSECLQPCDDAPCTAGTCVPWWDLTHVCVTDETRFHDAAIGEECPPPVGRYIFCDVVDGAARGLCNYDPASSTENACHALCSSAEETCGEGKFCLGAFFELDDTPVIQPEDPFYGSCEPR